MNHKEVLKDWKYLWSIGAADDMTGAYVDQEDLDRLLKNPCKRVAVECLITQMEHWFTVGPDVMGKRSPINSLKESLIDGNVIEIKEKYNF